MMRLTKIAFIAVVFFSLEACTDSRRAKNYNDTVIDADAQNFINKGSEGLNAGVQLSQLAIKTSHNAAIVDFAKGAVKENQSTMDDLKKLAANASAKTADTISQAHTLMMTELAKKSGNAFDKQYIQAMVEDNEHGIALFKTVTGNSNKNVAAFADKTLPKLREQLKHANEICTDLMPR